MIASEDGSTSAPVKKRRDSGEDGEGCEDDSEGEEKIQPQPQTMMMMRKTMKRMMKKRKSM